MNTVIPASAVRIADDVQEHFSYLDSFVSLDNPTFSELTRQLLGWKPTHRGLIDDLDEGHYFGD